MIKKFAKISKTEAQLLKKKTHKNYELYLFVYGVSIPGLIEAYRAPNRKWLALWLITLTLSILSLIYLSSWTIFKYYNQTSTVWESNQVFGVRSPFPNATFCVPSALHINKFMSVFPPEERVRKKLDRINRTYDDLVKYSMTLSDYSLKQKYHDEQLYPIALTALQQITLNFSQGYAEFVEWIRPSCEEIFSNCSFENQTFDCCKASQFIYSTSMVCFQIDVGQITEIKSLAEVKGGESEDSRKIQSSGLTVDIVIDWNKFERYLYESNEDGIYVLVGRRWSLNVAPVIIPSDMDVTIVLAKPKKLYDLTLCMRNLDDAPRLKDFDYYDDDGDNCFAEMALDLVQSTIGCRPPNYMSVPDNLTQCSFEAASILRRAMNGEIYNANNEKKIVQSIYNHGSCLPLCERWSYDITSTSYNAILYKSNRTDNGSHQFSWWLNDEEEKAKNWTLNRVRVFFPSASYWERVEKLTTNGYIVFCDVSNIMSWCSGMSVVTGAEIVAYGLVLAVATIGRRRLNRISPLLRT